MNLHNAFTNGLIDHSRHIVVSDHICHVRRVDGGMQAITNYGRHWYHVRSMVAIIDRLRQYFAEWDGGAL